ncbi:MAG: endo-1,4-beta-xylanase [Phycisphaerae bacterium]|nr:endo-1,4-beta-xylanase [Phycisphaerae bacterium]
MLTSLALLASLAALAAEPSPAARQLLTDADARIQKHRTADAVIKLTPKPGETLAAGTRVRIEQVRHAFLFGSNVFNLGRLRTPQDNEAYARRFAELLNFATLAFYWWSYEPQQGQPAYERSRRAAEWCWENGIVPKGHPLAWNWADPPWLPDDLHAVMNMQLTRISQCAQHFKGQIQYWDVVNEATHYDRPELKNKQAVKLTAAIAKIGVGPYVRKAFLAARQASPQAKLIINDYRLDADFENRVLKQLVDESGEKLYDVIGLQSHQHGGAIPAETLWAACERFGKYGKPLHWTETTFVSGEQGYNLAETRPGFKWDSTPEGEKRQAEDVTRFYTLLFSHPAVEAITWWDFSDQGAWQRAPAGLLRKDMSPKPAYQALLKLIKGKWWTKTEAVVEQDGTLRFHGFYGQYKVTVGEGEKERKGLFTLKPGTGEPIPVELQ